MSLLIQSHAITVRWELLWVKTKHLKMVDIAACYISSIEKGFQCMQVLRCVHHHVISGQFITHFSPNKTATSMLFKSFFWIYCAIYKRTVSCRSDAWKKLPLFHVPKFYFIFLCSSDMNMKGVCLNCWLWQHVIKPIKHYTSELDLNAAYKQHYCLNESLPFSNPAANTAFKSN